MPATFVGVPAADASGWAGVDVVVLGVADSVRTADPGPADGSRPNLALGVDPLRDLVVVDAGSTADVASVRAAGALAVVLGLDSDERDAPVLHFGAHAVGPRIHVGLRGYGAPPAGAARCIEMAEISARGLDVCLDDAFAVACERAHGGVVLVVDLDVVDPSMAPGVARPEPGGLTTRQLLDAVRRSALELPLVAVHVVGLPDEPVPAPTALLANRVVLEALSGVARRRQEAEQADL